MQVHVTEFCLRCSPRRLNHANWPNCINLSPMADYANKPTRFRCSPETHHSRQSIVTSLSRNSATRPSASFIRRGEDRSKRCHLRSIPQFLAMSRKKVTIYPVFTWPTHALLKRSLTSLLLSTYLLVWILQSSLSRGLMIGLMTVSSPSQAMFYSVETVRLVEAAFALLFIQHPLQKEVWSGVTRSWMHVAVASSSAPASSTLWHHRWCYVLPWSTRWLTTDSC